MIDRIREWREEPCKMVWENFQVEPDKWQANALNAFAKQDEARLRISLQACAGPGKSAVLAWCGLNFLSCYGEKGEHPKGACVAVTEDNLKNNLWPEFSKWMQRSPYLSGVLTWTKSRIFANDHPEDWFLGARSFPKTADADTLGKTLSGIHGKYILFLIDESGDIPIQVGKAAEQALSTADLKFGRILQAGNPISLDGMLYAAAISSKWYVIRITGDPEDENRSPRIDKQWAQEQIDEYGRDNPWVMAYILGQFPKSSINTLLSITEVEDAMARKYKQEVYVWSQKRLGVDVARFGLDSTVLFPRQGKRAFKYVRMEKQDSLQVASRVALAKQRWSSEVEFVDGTGGWGSGVIDALRSTGYSPQEINFAGKATDDKYYNKRAEMWFEMADWVRAGGWLPQCNELKKELVAPTYSFQKGRFLLESKEQIKKRLGFSPDRADALALTFAMADMPAQITLENVIKGHVRTSMDWNPIDQAGVSRGKVSYDYDPLG